MQPGDLIQSRYRLAQLLGSGASGSVWSAKNELIDREVALKIMRPEVAEDAVALQRFFNEAKASGRVRSPSIVEILDLGQAEDGSPFLVFELLQGEGFDAKLKREGTLESEIVLELFIGIAKALEVAHAQGIIHRDLKPANIFVHNEAGAEPVAKILDFGISKVFDNATNFSLTRTGMVVGSPAYMSPEQAAGQEDLDGRADLWSVGVVMYEALTGTLPHQAQNYNALMVRILTQDCDPVMTRKVDLPSSVCAIVDGCLRRERSERTASAAILAQQMESALREMRAIRYRSVGRRASDREAGEFKRRATDRKEPPGKLGPKSRRTDARALGKLSKSALWLTAAGVGLAFGLIAVVLLFVFGK